MTQSSTSSSSLEPDSLATIYDLMMYCISTFIKVQNNDKFGVFKIGFSILGHESPWKDVQFSFGKYVYGSSYMVALMWLKTW